MRLNALLTLAAIYMGLSGLGFILAPRVIGVGAGPEDASAALIAYLRILGSPFLGIAALNWTTRRLPPSPAHGATSSSPTSWASAWRPGGQPTHVHQNPTWNGK